MDIKPSLSPTLVLVCQECRRPWLEPRERWRMYLDSDELPYGVPYCPDCAAREFDGD
ncbi:MAG: hypothetical protein ACJ75Q_11310 [Gaiellaceae bacterium]